MCYEFEERLFVTKIVDLKIRFQVCSVLRFMLFKIVMNLFHLNSVKHLETIFL
jgi:hypothetical protein